LLLQDGRQEEARNLFVQLIAELKEELKNSRSYVNQYIDCHVGVALSYPESSEKRKEAALAAKKIVDGILAGILRSHTEKASLTGDFYRIRKFYISIETLVPTEDEKFHQQMAVQIALCTQYIPVLDNFHLELQIAEALLAQNNPQEARKLALEVLPSLSGDTSEINLAKIQGHILIAETFYTGIEDPDQHAKEAKNLALTAYENRGVETPSFYVNLIDSFSRLNLLLPGDALIKEKLKACTKVFTDYCAMSLSSDSIGPAVWFELAHKLINIRRLGIAQCIFLELLKFFENDESSLAISAQCHIGLAYIYADESFDQQLHLNQAKNYLDTALENNLKVDLSKATFKNLRDIKTLYRTIKDLDPKNLLGLHVAITKKIKTCTTNIPLLSNFYDELTYAKNISSENCEKAIEIVSTALKTLTEDKLAYNLARAKGYTLIAEMVSEKAASDQNSNLALTYALKAYGNYAESFIKNHRIQIYEQFIELFLRLRELLPNSPAIKEKLKECMCNQYEPISRESRGKNDHKVSNEPAGGRWKQVKILVAFFFATTVIVGIGVLGGHRYINKLN